MYGKLGAVAASGGAAAGLAYTGASVLWYVVAGMTLLAAGLAILRLTPKHRRR